MADKQTRPKNTTVKKAADKPGEITIVNQPIQVGQLQRGNKNVTKWMNAIRAVEQVMNPQRQQYYEICLDVSIDGHSTSVFEKRDRAVVTAELCWDGMPEGQHLDNLRMPWFYKLLKHVMSHRRYGYTVVEVKLKDGFFTDAQVVPRQHVLPEYKVITRRMTYTPGIDDLHYDQPPANDYLLEVGDIKDLGLYAVLAPYILMKRDNLADFSLHNELFAMPMRVYYYDPLNPDSRRDVEAQAKAQTAAAYVCLPLGATMDVKDSNKQGGAEAYNKLHGILNDEITIIVLGQILTTGGGDGGSHALGRVHQAVEQAVNLEDMLFVENWINGPFRDVAMRHGYPAWDRAYFKDTELLSATQRVNIWNIAKTAGARISPSAWNAEFDIPEPTPEEQEVLDRQAQEAADKEAANLEAQRLAAEANKQDKGQTETDDDDTDPEKKKPTKPGSVAARLGTLYSNLQILKPSNPQISASYQSDLSKAFDAIIARIHSGELKPGDVDQALFELVAAELYKAVQAGYGSAPPLGGQGVDAAMLADLRNNIYVFSGFKNYHTLKAATELLLNDSGQVRPFNEFKQLVLEVNAQYNVNYLEAEYNTALGNAQMASKWQDFEADKDTLPWLRFRAVMDDKTEHGQYNGITARVDDSIWNWLTPLLRFNCRCTLEQIAEGTPTPVSKLPSIEAIPEEFRFNPGKERAIFSQKHPYFTVDTADQDRAKTLFGLTIPKANS